MSPEMQPEVRPEMNLVEPQEPARFKKSSWWWRGVVASSLAGAAVLAFRGCWHKRMSWPIGAQGYSYQVCLSCGAKRLFDEATFSAVGPFRNDLNQLLEPGLEGTKGI
jgi:hypothetical protein